jgi:tetratricopeptide (TPR) repeat protein
MIRAALPLVFCLALAGCITTPLEERDWVRIQSQHFEVWSSLDANASMQIAVELERFRAATEFISGHTLPETTLPTRVYAFDDRGIGRPFSYRSQRSYLLTRQPGNVIVLRTGGGWEGDAWTSLKLDYARQLVWNASSVPLPPWLDEGLPQLASTLESRDEGATAGALRTDHVDTLRDSQWIPFERLLAATDLTGWSGLERGIFEAESWALCHYLTFDDGGIVPPGSLARFRSRIADGAEPGAAAREEFGELMKLQHDVWRAVRAAEFGESKLRIRWRGMKPVSRAVAQPELLEQLGALAASIGNNELAAEMLERSLEPGPGSARALARLGDVLDSRGDRAGADARYAAALAAAPDDAVIHLSYANLLRARAASGDPAERDSLAELARSHYARSIALEDGLAESHAGFAATYLVDGQDPGGTLEHTKTARKLLPGDPEIGLLSARIELALGEREAARRDAARELSRARSATDLEAARALLAQIDDRASIR